MIYEGVRCRRPRHAWDRGRPTSSPSGSRRPSTPGATCWSSTSCTSTSAGSSRPSWSRWTSAGAAVLIATIAARNYLSRVRVLARSFLAHNPGGRVAVLVVDSAGPGLDADEPFEVVTPAALGIEPAELRRMAAMYDVTEFSTVLKPWFLNYLLDRGEPVVTYLDPDIEVFASLADIVDLARRHTIVLTPHRLSPPSDDRLEPASRCSSSPAPTTSDSSPCRAGAALPGLVVRSTAASTASSTSARACSSTSGGSTSPSRTSTPTCCATPDATSPTGTWTSGPCEGAGAYTAGGAPLRFFHYSGFDPSRPAPPERASSRADLGCCCRSRRRCAELCARYAARLVTERWDECRRLPYGFDRAVNGMAIDRVLRRAFAEELRGGSGHGAGPGLDRGAGRPVRSGRGRRLHRHAALAPPQRLAADLPLPARVVPRPVRSPARASPNWPGSRATTSCGGSGRWVIASSAFPPNWSRPRPTSNRPSNRRDRCAPACGWSATSRPSSAWASRVAPAGRCSTPSMSRTPVIYERGTANRQRHEARRRGASRRTEGDDFDLNLVCVNADRLAGVLDRLGGSFTRHRRTIGLWAWEVEEFPRWMAGAQHFVDEIWTSSAHSSQAIRRRGRPARSTPFPCAGRQPTLLGSQPRGSSGSPLGSCSCSASTCISVPERKNPGGLIEAFCRAFAPGEGPQLVVKSINGDGDLPELERLRLLAGDRPDVHLVDGYLDASDQQALLECLRRATCHCTAPRGSGTPSPRRCWPGSR